MKCTTGGGEEECGARGSWYRSCGGKEERKEGRCGGSLSTLLFRSTITSREKGVVEVFVTVTRVAQQVCALTHCFAKFLWLSFTLRMPRKGTKCIKRPLSGRSGKWEGEGDGGQRQINRAKGGPREDQTKKVNVWKWNKSECVKVK